MGLIWSHGTSIDADYRQVGSYYNGWRKPVSKFASDEGVLARCLRGNPYIGNNDLTDEIWWKSCGAVDEITRLVHSKLKKIASRSFPCLSFKDFVKQGSCREGLKIRHPNEFDMILPFIIEGVDVHAVPARDENEELIPGHIKLQISDTQIPNVMDGSRYQSLRTNKVFESSGTHLFLNANCFQMRVISSIMDTTMAEIQNEIDAKNRNEACSFTLSKTIVFPPTYRFKITITSDADIDEMSHVQNRVNAIREARIITPQKDFEAQGWTPSYKVIEFDIVPGLLLHTDFVPNPNSWLWRNMPCDRYAVMKWIHKRSVADDYPEPDLIWRESLCGYEKHILDVSSRNDSDAYILTACRILKAYLDGLGNSSQLSSLLSSYHIKNIAIHCILLQLRVSGVKEALGYLIAFLEISVEMKFLPHYFYGNRYISNMFPKVPTDTNQRRLNLFRKIHHDHLEQAILSLGRMKADLHGLYTEKSNLGRHQSIDSFRNLCTL